MTGKRQGRHGDRLRHLIRRESTKATARYTIGGKKVERTRPAPSMPKLRCLTKDVT